MKSNEILVRKLLPLVVFLVITQFSIIPAKAVSLRPNDDKVTSSKVKLSIIPYLLSKLNQSTLKNKDPKTMEVRQPITGDLEGLLYPSPESRVILGSAEVPSPPRPVSNTKPRTEMNESEVSMIRDIKEAYNGLVRLTDEPDKIEEVLSEFGTPLPELYRKSEDSDDYFLKPFNTDVQSFALSKSHLGNEKTHAMNSIEFVLKENATISVSMLRKGLGNYYHNPVLSSYPLPPQFVESVKFNLALLSENPTKECSLLVKYIRPSYDIGKLDIDIESERIVSISILMDDSVRVHN
jgi:hypothetical protein